MKIWLESEGITDQNFTKRLDLDSILSNIFKEEYEGIQITAGFYDKKKKIYHGLAILNRETETMRLKKDISRINFEASKIYNTGFKQEGINDFYFSLQNYFAAEEKKFEVLSKGLLYLAIRPEDEVSSRLPKETFGLSMIEERLESFIKDLTLSAISPLEINIKSAAETEPIQVSFSRVKGDKKTPFEGAPFISEIKAGGADLIRRPKTNQNGVCTLRFTNVKAGPAGFIDTKIKFDTSSLRKYYKNPLTLFWLSELEKKSLDFKYVF